ncbi:hypothetical protein [Gorillibacterium timonense]|uniref:hypothetical protein n=1 Tax=Gorillibacterium timonense TaxID=1689269 RepID=UPI00071CC31A|nr:hypothetical protein [Gorillibacterium timonense]
MNGITRFAIITLLSAAIGIGLSMLPRIDSESESRPASAGTEATSRYLSSSNLVDHLEALPFYLNLRHVAWEAPMLTVDFNAPSAVDVAAVYSDLYRLIRHGLEDTTNVEEVRIRVYGKKLGSSAQAPLLLAADARREDEIRFSKKQVGSTEQLKRFLETRCRLTETERWRSMLSD